MQPALSFTHTHVQTHSRRQNTRHRRILSCPPKGMTNQVRPHGIVLSHRKPQLHTPRNKGTRTRRKHSPTDCSWGSLCPVPSWQVCLSSSPWKTDLIRVLCPPPSPFPGTRAPQELSPSHFRCQGLQTGGARLHASFPLPPCLGFAPQLPSVELAALLFTASA